MNLLRFLKIKMIALLVIAVIGCGWLSAHAQPDAAQTFLACFVALGFFTFILYLLVKRT